MGKEKNSNRSTNAKSSSNSRNNNGKFNLGTPLEFNVYKQKFLALLESLTCRELVEGEGPETVFSVPRPCAEGQEAAFVQANQDAQKAKIIAAYKLNYKAVIDSGIPVSEKKKKVLELKLNKTNKLTDLENSQVVAMQSLNTQISNWEKQRETFLKKKGACIQAFHESFGPAPIATCAKYLKKGEVRAAWNCLVNSYNAGVGGQQNVANIMKMLNNFNFSAYSCVSEAVEAIRSLAEQVSEGGATCLIPDKLLLEMFLGGVERSNNNSFNDIISDIRKESFSFDEAMQLFYERESTLLIKKQSETAGKGESSSNGSSVSYNEQELYSMLCHLADGKFGKKLAKKMTSFGKKPVVKSAEKSNKHGALICSVCQKPGHSGERCWSKKVCNICKEIGHIEKYCPKNSKNKGQFKVSNYVSGQKP